MICGCGSFLSIRVFKLRNNAKRNSETNFACTLTDRNWEFRYKFLFLFFSGSHLSRHRKYVGRLKEKNRGDNLSLASSAVCPARTDICGRMYPLYQVPIGKYAKFDGRIFQASYCGDGTVATALQITVFYLCERAHEREHANIAYMNTSMGSHRISANDVRISFT